MRDPFARLVLGLFSRQPSARHDYSTLLVNIAKVGIQNSSIRPLLVHVAPQALRIAFPHVDDSRALHLRSLTIRLRAWAAFLGVAA